MGITTMIDVFIVAKDFWWLKKYFIELCGLIESAIIDGFKLDLISNMEPEKPKPKKYKITFKLEEPNLYTIGYADIALEISHTTDVNLGIQEKLVFSIKKVIADFVEEEIKNHSVDESMLIITRNAFANFLKKEIKNILDRSISIKMTSKNGGQWLYEEWKSLTP